MRPLRCEKAPAEGCLQSSNQLHSKPNVPAPAARREPCLTMHRVQHDWADARIPPLVAQESMRGCMHGRWRLGERQ